MPHATVRYSVCFSLRKHEEMTISLHAAMLKHLHRAAVRYSVCFSLGKHEEMTRSLQVAVLKHLYHAAVRYSVRYPFLKCCKVTHGTPIKCPIKCPFSTMQVVFNTAFTVLTHKKAANNTGMI